MGIVKGRHSWAHEPPWNQCGKGTHNGDLGRHAISPCSSRCVRARGSLPDDVGDRVRERDMAPEQPGIPQAKSSQNGYGATLRAYSDARDTTHTSLLICPMRFLQVVIQSISGGTAKT